MWRVGTGMEGGDAKGRSEQSTLGDVSWVLCQPEPVVASQEKCNHSGEEASMELPTSSPRWFPRGESLCPRGLGGRRGRERYQRLSSWRVEVLPLTSGEKDWYFRVTGQQDFSSQSLRTKNLQGLQSSSLPGHMSPGQRS